RVLSCMAERWRPAHWGDLLGARAGLVQRPASSERAARSLQQPQGRPAWTDAADRELPWNRDRRVTLPGDDRALRDRLHASNIGRVADSGHGLQERRSDVDRKST